MFTQRRPPPTPLLPFTPLFLLLPLLPFFPFSLPPLFTPFINFISFPTFGISHPVLPLYSPSFPLLPSIPLVRCISPVPQSSPFKLLNHSFHPFPLFCLVYLYSLLLSYSFGLCITNSVTPSFIIPLRALCSVYTYHNISPLPRPPTYPKILTFLLFLDNCVPSFSPFPLFSIYFPSFLLLSHLYLNFFFQCLLSLLFSFFS